MSMVINPMAFMPVDPIGPDPYWDYVVLLLGFNGANGSTTFTDDSQSAHSFSASGDAQITTAETLFGQSTYAGDGDGDWISTLDSLDWSFGSGDFTVEGFVFFSDDNAASGLLGIYDGSSGLGSSWGLYTEGGVANTLNWFAYGTSGGITTPYLGYTSGTWYYFCAERADSTLRIYFGPDGGTAAMVGTTTQTGVYHNSTSDLRVGGISNLYTSFNGNLKEIRITKTVARYATDAGFPVPTNAFPRHG